MKISIYDFDKTMYNGDSFIDFWLYYVKKNIVKLIYLPILIIKFILWKAKILTTQSFKQNMINIFNSNDVNSYVTSFWSKKKHKISPWVDNFLSNDKKNNYESLVISASPIFLLEPVLLEIGIKRNNIICTNTIINKNRLKITGKNCKGKEKVQRLLQWQEKNGFQEIEVTKMVSDSKVDMPLYELAEEKYRVVNGNIEEGMP